MLMSVMKGMQMVTWMQKMKKMMRNCATRSIQVIHITLTCSKLQEICSLFSCK